MLLSTVNDEFVFHCQSRNLSPKTIKNYRKQIEYLQIHNKVIILLLIDTGIRMSELISLTEEQLKYNCKDRRS